MIVYGKHRKKYVLSEIPVSQEFDGAVYSVPSNADIHVKIYQHEFRTPEKEREVTDTINGTRSMLDEFPVDIVYTNGRFAGYICERSADPMPSPEPEPLPRPAPRTNTPIPFVITIASGLLMSFLIYFVIFDMIEKVCSDPCVFWNMKGIPMIAAGWIFMLLIFSKSDKDRISDAVYSIAAFILGAVSAFCLISLLVMMLSATAIIVSEVISDVIPLLLMIYAIKFLLRKIR